MQYQVEANPTHNTLSNAYIALCYWYGFSVELLKRSYHNCTMLWYGYSQDRSGSMSSGELRVAGPLGSVAPGWSTAPGRQDHVVHVGKSVGAVTSAVTNPLAGLMVCRLILRSGSGFSLLHACWLHACVLDAMCVACMHAGCMHGFGYCVGGCFGSGGTLPASSTAHQAAAGRDFKPMPTPEEWAPPYQTSSTHATGQRVSGVPCAGRSRVVPC